MTVLRIALLAALVVPCTARARAADVATLEEQALNAATDEVADSVVQIRTIGGLEQVDEQVLAQGPTTGLIVTADGYIVSSAFNFAQQPSSILVRLPTGEQKPAELVGHDTNRMLVLLKVEADEPLPVPKPASMKDVRPGDWAVALGRTYRDDRVSMSVGVVSALARMHGRALQTDANVSAANYGGPLVDVHGRVLGILVPMSPQPPGGSGEASAVAGAEFYDSGIGFAVPLEHVLAVLERWKDKKELKRGVLGVSLKPGNAHATPPVVTTVWPRSPAAEAGWKKGDRIIAVDGVKVASQTELRFQVTPRYAGEKLKVTLGRGKSGDREEIETTVTLAEKLPAFRHAFLGILPKRAAENEPAKEDPKGEAEEAKAKKDKEANEDDDEAAAETSDSKGIEVRAVWPESPADEAGLRAGDIITRLGDRKIDSAEAAIGELNGVHPEEKLEVRYLRDEDAEKAEVKLGELPIDILASSDLPTKPAGDEDDEAAEPKVEELKLPEMPQTARFFQPPSKGSPRGLLIWLGDGKEETAKSLAANWAKACRRDGLVLLMPEPADAAGWTSDDMEYLGRLVQTAVRRFDVDPRRIVVAGEGKGGQMAYALAFAGRRLIRGVAVLDSPLPRTLDVPENSPNERLAILSVETQSSPLSLLIRRDLLKLSNAGFPATQLIRRGDDEPRQQLDAATRAKIARWIDGLDRF